MKNVGRYTERSIMDRKERHNAMIEERADFHDGTRKTLIIITSLFGLIVLAIFVYSIIQSLIL